MANKLKILLSEQNQQIIESITDFMADKPVEFYICSKNGNTLLNNIVSIGPDVVICDIFMSELDAISVKEKADLLDNIPKVFMIASSYDNDYIIKRALAAGFSYYFIKPYSPENLYHRIQSAYTGTASGMASDEMYIADILHSLEMPSHLKGYSYIKQAVKMVLVQPEYINNITKGLYPDVAAEFNTTASRVERSMRTAIETAWERSSTDTKEIYFRYFTQNYIKPSNSEFIASIAEYIRNHIEYRKMC